MRISKPLYSTAADCIPRSQPRFFAEIHLGIACILHVFSRNRIIILFRRHFSGGFSGFRPPKPVLWGQYSVAFLVGCTKFSTDFPIFDFASKIGIIRDFSLKKLQHCHNFILAAGILTKKFLFQPEFLTRTFCGVFSGFFLFPSFICACCLYFCISRQFDMAKRCAYNGDSTKATNPLANLTAVSGTHSFPLSVRPSIARRSAAIHPKPASDIPAGRAKRMGPV